MMNYTVTANEQRRLRINQHVQAHIDYISRRVAGLLGDRLHSLLLCGGFGRGEGSVVVDENGIHIVNDYDFTVVLNAKTRLRYFSLYKKIHAPLERLAAELAAELRMKQVDLSPKPLAYFSSHNPLKIENYEVRMGHVLVHGDRNPTIDMPRWKAEDIPLFEGTWLFRNRGAGLLLAALYFLDADQIDDAKKENLIIECTKAHLAMGDAVLLLKRQYHHLYHRRLGTMEGLDLSGIPSGEDVRDRYRDALKQKLSPDFNRYLQRDLRRWWFDVAGAFGQFFRFYEQQRLGLEFPDWLTYAELRKPEDKVEMKTLAGKLIKSGRSELSIQRVAASYRRSKKSFSISLVALVLFSLREDGFDTDMMAKAAERLDLKLSGNPMPDWLSLARSALAEIHPGGEAGRVLRRKPSLPDPFILRGEANQSLRLRAVDKTVGVNRAAGQ